MNTPRSVINYIHGGKVRIYDAVDRSIARHYAGKQYVCTECRNHITHLLDVALNDVCGDHRPRVPRILLRHYCAQLLQLIRTCSSPWCTDVATLDVFREIYMLLYRL